MSEFLGKKEIFSLCLSGFETPENVNPSVYVKKKIKRGRFCVFVERILPNGVKHGECSVLGNCGSETKTNATFFRGKLHGKFTHTDSDDFGIPYGFECVFHHGKTSELSIDVGGEKMTMLFSEEGYPVRLGEVPIEWSEDKQRVSFQHKEFTNLSRKKVKGAEYYKSCTFSLGGMFVPFEVFEQYFGALYGLDSDGCRVQVILPVFRD